MCVCVCVRESKRKGEGVTNPKPRIEVDFFTTGWHPHIPHAGAQPQGAVVAEDGGEDAAGDDVPIGRMVTLLQYCAFRIHMRREQYGSNHILMAGVYQ